MTIYIHHTEVLSVLAQGLFISKSIPMWDHVKIVFFFFFFKVFSGQHQKLVTQFPSIYICDVSSTCSTNMLYQFVYIKHSIV